MKNNLKICFLLNSSREIDMYTSVYEKFSKEEITFLINDYDNKNLFEEDLIKIEDFLIDNGLTYEFLSSIYGKKKFKLLVSTGDLPIKKFKLFSFLKYLYAKSFGLLIENFNLKIYLRKKFNRDFTAGGNKAEFLSDEFVEKRISENTVKFPNGLDRNIKFFPNKKWKNNFDYYLTSSLIEDRLIKKKFPDKKTFLIGYSRFNEKNINEEKKLIEEFNLDNSKKNIYCSPSEWIMLSQNKSSIMKFVSFLKELDKNYNLIFRPHPKLKYTSPDFFKLFKDSKLKLDLNPFRKLQYLFNLADLVIADFGSSVLESIYLNKKILIYNWQDEENQRYKYDKMNSLDGLIRNKLVNTNDFNEEKIIDHIKDLILDKSYQNKIADVNLSLFGDKKEYALPNKILREIYDNETKL